MIETNNRTWETKRTDQTRAVERALREAGFEQSDAYRYNSAAIRLRVIDPRFEGLKIAERDALVDPILETLPEETQGDIMSLYTFAPSEVDIASVPHARDALRHRLQNMEFEDPSPSII